MQRACAWEMIVTEPPEETLTNTMLFFMFTVQLVHIICVLCMFCVYCMAGNFGRKIFWWIAEIMTLGGIYFGGWESLSHNDFYSKMANRTHWELNWAVRLASLDRTTPTQKQRTVCQSSSVSGRQRHQHRSLQRPRTHRLDCFNKPTLLPPMDAKTPWRRDILVRSCGWWTPCRRLHWRAQLQAYCTRGSYDYK